MKKMKKIFAVILSLAMVLGMSLTAFAAKGVAPNASDSTTATVNNVEVGATVTAYRIVEPVYGTNGGFKEYKAVSGITLADPVKPTSNEITSIADGITANKITGLQSVGFVPGEADSKGLATFTASLNPGYWVVIVTGSNVQEVYNPMLIGVYYSLSGSDGELTSQPVDANTNWSLESTPVYAKSSQPTLDKKITGSTVGNTNTDNTDANMNGNGNDVAIGDTVSFQIDTVIPSYSGSYKDTEVRVEISDELSKGLDLIRDSIKVYVGGEDIESSTEVTAAVGRYTVSKVEGATDPERTFKISFDSDYALQYNGQKVFVTYNATLNEDAETNFDPNTNTAKLTYTNDPSDNNSVKDIDDKTYTYTFEIDGNLSGKYTEEWNKITEELLKGVKKDETITTDTRENFEPLAGATFTLTNNATNKVYTTTSDSKGMLNFKGLDAGTYTLRETVAPEGYSINDAEIPVEITAVYKEDGQLESYSIKVNNKNTSTYTATYEGEKITHVEYDNTSDDKDEDISDSFYFWNTTLANLPSTGGIGTTIFTIGGCAIMIIAAGLFFASRRKSDAK